MTHLYMARRRIYPAETAVFGPFSNHAAALACAQDSLYPELAEVTNIDLSRVSTLYVPQTSYPDWVLREETTYYGFQESFEDIPAHLQTGLTIEIADLNSFAVECFDQSPENVTESMMIAGLVYGIDQHYECMHVIRATQDSALTALAIAQPFDRLVRARGYHDRLTLLNLVENSKQIRDWSVEYIDSYISQADLLAQTFWERFVIDHSQVPEADLDNWRF
jgi:hypothetical protein